MKLFLDKIKTNFKNNKWPLLIVLVVWALVVVLTLSFYGSTLGKQSHGNRNFDEVVELTNTTTVVEELEPEDGTESISFRIATYARKNKGNLNVLVEGINSNTVYTNKEIDVSSLQDNAYVTVELDKTILIAKDSKIKITLSSDCEKGKAVGVYFANWDAIEDGAFTINNKVNKGDLTIRFLTESEELNTFYKIIITWTISIITIIILIILLIKPKFEVLFTIIAASIGLTFCFVMTPLSIPDEMAHYEYSFQMSNYMMFEDNHMLFDADYQDYGSYEGHNNTSSAYKKVLQRFNSELNLDNKLVEMDNDIDETYGVYFIPQGLGITLARLFNMNRVKTFYLGRIFNLAFYTLCIYLAIKKVPMHKVLFGLIATLPMFMQQAASYSYDAFVNGLVFVVIAYLLKFLFAEEKIATKEIVTVAIVSTLLAPAKIVYGFISFLFWLVPYTKYKNKKTKVISTLLICASPIYQILSITIPVLAKSIENMSELNGFKLTNIVFADDGEVVEEIFDDSYQKITIGYMIRNPIDSFMIFFRTTRYSLKNWFYDSFGRTLSGVSLILPTTLVHLLVIPVFLAAFRKEKYVEPIYLKVIFIVLCIVIGIYILGGFLLSWTNMNQDIIKEYGGIVIEGVQGRYFCPLLPFVFTIFNNKKINIPEKFDKYIIISQLFVVFGVIVYILSYTFVN